MNATSLYLRKASEILVEAIYRPSINQVTVYLFISTEIRISTLLGIFGPPIRVSPFYHIPPVFAK